MPVVVTRFEVVEEIHVRPSEIAYDEQVTVPIRSERIDVRRTPLGANAATPSSIK